MRRRLLLGIVAVAAALELGACGGDPPPPTSVAFVGTLIQQRFQSSDPFTNVDGADAFVTGSSDAAVLSQTKTDANGRFVLGGLAKNAPVNLVFSKTPDYMRSVFAGSTENYDSLLFYGSVFEAKATDAQAIVAEYAAAASVASNDLMVINPSLVDGTNGAMVRGKVVRLVQTPQGLAYENVKSARVTVTDANGTSYRVFYRGDFPNDTDPGPIEPARTSTGSDSRWVAFGVDAHGLTGLPFPAGKITVSVETSQGTYPQPSIAVFQGITEMDLFAVP